MSTDGGVGGRHQARERALALLYEAEAKGRPPADVLEDQAMDPDPYAEGLVRGVSEHIDELDALITRYAIGWTLERMAALDRAALRLGAFELGHRPDVPTGVVLSEAVELASQYSTDDSGRFVNGLLAKIATELRPA